MTKTKLPHHWFLVLIVLLTINACSTNVSPITATPLLFTPTASSQNIEPTATSIPSMSQYFQTDDYILKSTMQLGDYRVQSWENSSVDNIWGRSRVSIHAVFQTIWIDNAVLGQLPQDDITGEGHPDVIVYIPERVWKDVIIYDLGNERTYDKVTRVFYDSIPRDCNFEFKDLNNDGVPEIINCDRAFGFFNCGPSWGPMPLIVYSYDSNSMQYHNVSPLYPEIYKEPIETLTELAEKSPKDKCLISGLLMNYFYSGQIEKGWAELHNIYQGQDVDSFQKEMEDMLQVKRRAGMFVLLEDLKAK